MVLNREPVILLTAYTFGVFSSAFTPTGAVVTTLNEAINCDGVAAILTSHIQIRNPEFNFR